MTDLRDRPIIICGHPKAGTSLLRNLMDSHPQLVVYPEESVFFRRFLPLLKENSATPLALARETLIHIFAWNQENPPDHQSGFPDRDYSEFSFDAIANRLEAVTEAGGIRHEGDWLSAAVLAYGEEAGVDLDKVQRWVEKTPYNEYFAEQIYQWWPDARCIHIVREPCDNYASYKRKQEHWSAEFFSANWVRSTSAGFANQKRYGQDHYMILRFEDLVEVQEETLAKICDFLEIEDDPTLRVPSRAGKNWGGNSMFGDQFEKISSAPVGRWQNILTEREAARIQLITGKYRTRLGYSEVSPRKLEDRILAGYWQARMKLYALLKN